MKVKFYSLKNILKEKAQYNMIIGERSNGKTYSVLEYALKKYFETGEQLAVVRRWQEDFRGKRGSQLFAGINENGVVSKLSDGEWTHVRYWSKRWYMAKFDEDTQKWIMQDDAFAYAFALSEQEHDKSISYPLITTILFDEFLTRGMYLQDEFVTFINVVSTIVRYRENVLIFMLGNTVNKYSPYFAEMGITHIDKMEQDTIDVYTYGESSLKVAVEYCGSLNKSKPSDSYFAFNNPKLEMITSGVWEVALYPHCPVKYLPKEILYVYFIKFGNDVLQCEIIQHEDTCFTFIHRKTTPIKNETKDLIFSPEYSNRPNYRRRITKPTTKIEKKIVSFFITDKVFYQSNEIGEIVRNYLNWSKNEKTA